MTIKPGRSSTRRGALVVMLAGLLAVPSLSAGQPTGALRISHPWARPAMAGRAGAGYLTITNTGKAPAMLAGATSPVADRVTIHEMRMNGAVMRMRTLSSLSIAPGATLTLAPGGAHLMLEGLKRDLKPGDRAPLTLTFAGAGQVKVDLVVESPAPHHHM
ncbi:MAG TPA: copper chaperone PCu(A)C [Caulobacteraceae bacterium]|nr:copper chaperone PCu(A)C [Caulobacteraceae bacterium]